MSSSTPNPVQLSNCLCEDVARLAANTVAAMCRQRRVYVIDMINTRESFIHRLGVNDTTRNAIKLVVVNSVSM